MKRIKMLIAGCLAVACSTSSLCTHSNNLWGQSAPAQVRVRAIAGSDGKLEVVEEQIIGAEGAAGEKKEGKEEEKTLRARVIRRVQEAIGDKNADKEDVRKTEVLTEDFWGEMPQSDYWLGVQIAPVAPEIRKHLPVKHGILVVHVYPDSPALKAEVKADDILLQAGDAKLETGPDLVKAVEAAKETELSLIILREGKETKINVAPAKRAEAAKVQELYSKVAPLQREKLQEATKQLEKALATLRAENAEEGAVDLMMVRPGAFFYSNVAPKMPDDLTIQITKEGSKPAKVQVKKGEKSWEATADKLDALPADIRLHVEQFLSGGSSGVLNLTVPGAEANLSRFQMKVAPPVPGAYVPMTVPAPHTTRLPTVPAVPGVATVTAVPPMPASPGMAPAMARAATAWSHAVSQPASDAKLDQILKKLDSLSSPDLEEMKKELKSLRKEVDELRKKNVER